MATATPSAESLWDQFNLVDREAVVNALRRWQTSFGHCSSQRGSHSRAQISDPYVRLILDRCLPAEVEKSMFSEPLDRLMQEVIAVRTSVIDETLLKWCKDDSIKQVVILASGFDTRAWRLRWPKDVAVFEIDSAMIQSQKLLALGEIAPNCNRSALIGDVYSLGPVFRRLAQLNFDPALPSIFVVEDVIEYMLPDAASDMFEAICAFCARGSRMVVTLSDVKLRELLKRFGHTVHLIEEYEAPGIVLFRINNAGWEADLMLSGELETRFEVDLHGCLYVCLARKP